MLSPETYLRLETYFRELDHSIRLALANSLSPKDVAMAVLALADDAAQAHQLSATQISHLLECARVALTPLQITRAFARAGTQITRLRRDGETYFTLMTKGRLAIEYLIPQGPIEIVRIEAGRPRTGRRQLEQVLAPIAGLVRVCDPYYGVRSLDSLALIPAPCNVRFLTAITSEKATSLAGPIADFKRERPIIEMRILPPPISIHDRYILTSDTLLILGHGIKDIGSKDSFIVVVSSAYALDLISHTESSFDQNWSKATPL